MAITYFQIDLSNYDDHNVDIEDDESGWETVTHLEDQSSSCSPEGSAPSIRNRRDSNVSRSGIEWEDNGYEGTPITEISEVCSMPTKPLKKVSSIASFGDQAQLMGKTTR
ncbi:hypothetical protein Dsin_023096 [Dipteronia sinensis]|uniref:Uncharacterized protein n=1 Tax=Dipteronia sinensis TaxID=43782 RepID=A0AAE0A2Q8_9ROSI|nr:hypothetical protein Dsin_023095 [Dipteronia sinensis]KAK3199681.1 hypothetical protein Dsin_023096 [Dipteronia sinensis]